MRHQTALLMIGAAAWMPVAIGSECFSIKDDDQRNACLASAKNDQSYCLKIPANDLREACLAQLKGETYGCFKIQDPDAQAAQRSSTELLIGSPMCTLGVLSDAWVENIAGI